MQHFNSKYGVNQPDLPLWMVAEIIPFGAMFTLCNGVEAHIMKKLASSYDVPDIVLESWLGTLNAIRNICAHHGRLWNRQLGFRPKIPRKRKHPQWHSPVAIPDNRIFSVLTILKYMLSVVAPQSKWPERLYRLLQEYPDVPPRDMGFPIDWELSPLWEK